jgi:hypothetical protein
MKNLETCTPNTIEIGDEPGPGGANHDYSIYAGEILICPVEFQRGPRNEDDRRNGVLEDDLLAIIEHRLAAFQAGPYACEHNARAMEGIRIARRALADRVAERTARGVMGRSVA